MRLYDFRCRGCGKSFEDLVQDVKDARCPQCASAEVDKQLSAFSVGGASGAASEPVSFGGGCGTGMCGTGGCGLD